MLKHIIDIFNINLLKSITDSDSEEDENSKSLIGYGTFLCSQENNTFDESVTYNTNEQPKQPIDSTSDSLTDFRHSPRKNPNLCLQSSNSHDSIGKLKLNIYIIGSI